MAGIYIHIPFCKQACHYCNFHFSTSLQYKNDFLTALLNEIQLRKEEISGQPTETIYLGGGTPGILSVEEIESILTELRKNYDCNNVKEITIEMNPDDVTTDKMIGLKKLGVNRVSLGVQSFFEEDLLYMNRSHSAEKAEQSIAILHEYFANYTVDLIYGYPLLSDIKLEQNVNRLLAKGAPHISIYGMTVEPKTALDSFIKKGKEQAMIPKQGAQQFEYLMKKLPEHDFEHYEISSYAKPGFRAIHNSNYWAGKPYLGLGPGAHSFQGNRRSWNVANNALYIKTLEKNELPQEHEILSQTEILNEMVMLGLRVKEGLDTSEYQKKSSEEQFNQLLFQASSFIEKAWLEKSDTHLYLTNQGKLYCDGISADLFV
jgi:oxygen-independent coproporphyrinogen-3 oxidase